MSTMNINLDELRGEINNLSEQEIAKQLLALRTRQKVQQKKYANTDTQKAYRLKRAASIKEMTERAKKAPATKPGFKSLYDQIKAEADAAADELLGIEAAENDTEEVETAA